MIVYRATKRITNVVAAISRSDKASCINVLPIGNLLIKEGR